MYAFKRLLDTHMLNGGIKTLYTNVLVLTFPLFAGSNTLMQLADIKNWAVE